MSNTPERHFERQTKYNNLKNVSVSPTIMTKFKLFTN